MRKSDTHSGKKGRSKAAGTSLDVIPWITGVVVLLGLATTAGLYWGGTARIQDVRLTGNYFVESKEIMRKADIPLGVRSDSLDYRSIIKSIEEIPYVKYANVSVEPSGRLLIQVTERRPLGMLSDGDQKVYVDADGLKLPMILGKTADVPILYGFRSSPVGDTLNSVAFRSVSDFLAEVNSRPVSNATISEVAWTEKEGIVALTNENGVRLIFGNGDFRSRLRNWEAFYGEIVRQKGINSMQLIDLRFRGQIVTREI